MSPLATHNGLPVAGLGSLGGLLRTPLATDFGLGNMPRATFGMAELPIPTMYWTLDQELAGVWGDPADMTDELSVASLSINMQYRTQGGAAVYGGAVQGYEASRVHGQAVWHVEDGVPLPLAFMLSIWINNFSVDVDVGGSGLVTLYRHHATQWEHVLLHYALGHWTVFSDAKISASWDSTPDISARSLDIVGPSGSGMMDEIGFWVLQSGYSQEEIARIAAAIHSNGIGAIYRAGSGWQEIVQL